MLMSFVGCVGTLMASTGLEEVMKTAFGGVNRMLLGKNFLHNTRAIRMVAEELRHGIVQHFISYDKLIAFCNCHLNENCLNPRSKVKLRVKSALSDLHAADGRYHRDC